MMGIILLTVTSLILSIIIVVINSLINKKDKDVEEIEKLLPGLNCGSCGYGSCKGMALEILKELEAYKNCRPLRGEKKDKLEEYLNIKKM